MLKKKFLKDFLQQACEKSFEINTKIINSTEIKKHIELKTD